MRRLLLGLALLLCALPAWSQTATVSGNLKTVGVTNATTPGTKVTFTLQNYASNIPRVSGSYVVAQASYNFTPDANGAISGSVIRNDQITPAGTYYQVCIYDAGRQFRCANYNIAATSFDLNSAAPITTSPVVTPPTGDTTYLRTDGGNQMAGNIIPNTTDTRTLGNSSARFDATLDDVIAGKVNNIFSVDGVTHTTIQAAITAAGTTGAVLIPSNIPTTESYTNPNGIPIIDLRYTRSLGTAQYIIPSYPITNFPLGNDLALSAQGPADIYLTHNSHVSAATTTTASLSVGANNNVLVGSTANFAPNTAIVGLLIGRGTTNEEEVASGSWAIVDATHINVTCAKTHSGTTDIEQLGNTVIDAGTVLYFRPTNAPNKTRPITVRFVDSVGTPLFYLPTDKAGDSFPYNAIGFNAAITGYSSVLPHPTAADLTLRNAGASTSLRLLDNAGLNVFVISEGKSFFGGPITSAMSGGTPASTGSIRFLTGDSIRFRDNANSADILGMNKDTSDVVFLGDAAGVGLTGKISTYNNIATVAGGVPAEYATVNLTAQGAAIGATTLYAVPASGAGQYRVCFNMKLTQAATTSSVLGGTNGFQLVYTDQDDSVVVTTVAGLAFNSTVVNLALNTTQAQMNGCLFINAKASTNIQYQVDYTSVGATGMAYNLHIVLEKL